MKAVRLILFSRVGCCLCEELERRLRSLSLKEFTPPLELYVIDIDSADTSKDLHARYELQVPVMFLERGGLNKMFELPRVSPRLNNEGLCQWLQKILTKTVGSD